MTNFERATLRMQARGCRPFQPDTNHGRSERTLRRAAIPELEPASLPIDRLIGVVGMVGVVVIAILLLVEKVAA